MRMTMHDVARKLSRPPERTVPRRAGTAWPAPHASLDIRSPLRQLASALSQPRLHHFLRHPDEPSQLD